MTRENSNKLSAKKEQMKKSTKKTDELSKKKKQHIDSDDEGDDFISESDSEEMDVHEYRKFLSKIFPSKHLDKKIAAGEKIKKIYEQLQDDDEEEWETDEDEDYEDEDDEEVENKIITRSKSKAKENTKSNSKNNDKDKKNKKTKSPAKSKNVKPAKKSKKVVDEEDEDEEYDDDDEEEYDDDVEIKGGEKLNIIFTIGGAEDEDEWDEDYDSEEDDDAETEDEDVSVSSASSSDEDEEEDDDDDEEEYDEEEDVEVVRKKSKKPKSKQLTKKEKRPIEGDEQKEDLIEKLKKLLKNGDKSNENTDNSETNQTSNDSVLDKLKEMLSQENNNKLLKKCIDFCEEDIKKTKAKQEKKMKKQKAKNVRIFRKIIKDKNTMNDYKFFENLETDNQKKIIKELKEINKLTRIEKPYRMTLLESEIPTLFKGAAMKKINSLKYMEPGSGEFYKIKNWVDTFMRIPFGNFETLPLTIEDGVDKCHEFMENAQKTLDEAVYGLNDAKMQIMQMLGQLLTNPKAIGTAIAIHGPPGTGKTSLVKEGISKILNRPFAFIALGGATDSSFLEGHSYTYEGSTWGKIVQILIDSKCMNPVIYFDELDKISDTPRGEEIAGILTHLTDTSQNSQFHDKYFAEINFDLSKCLFIFSYNDESKVNPILKDRMYRIQTKGYNHYLLPKIREQVRFNTDEIIIPDEVIQYLVDTHCNKEDGVRNLKRCLEIIHTKLNLYRLMKPETNLFEEDMSIKVEFPLTINKEIVDKLIKVNKENVSALYNMYV